MAPIRDEPADTDVARSGAASGTEMAWSLGVAGGLGQRPAIGHLGKMLRIDFMVKGLLAAGREAPVDEAGCARLRALYEAAGRELVAALSPGLSQELDGLLFSFDEGATGSAEVVVALAQLGGWIDGLSGGMAAAGEAWEKWADEREPEAWVGNYL